MEPKKLGLNNVSAFFIARTLFNVAWPSRTPVPADMAWEQLIKAYRPRTDTYHGLHHIIDVIQLLLEHKELIEENWDYLGTVSPFCNELLMAIFFHDTIYDVTKNNNKDMSFRFYHALARSEDKRSDRFNQRVKHLIMATTHKDSPPPGQLANLLCCLDLLAGLRPDWDTFQKKGELIRREYAIYSDDEWRAGRKKFFEGMLAKPTIFWIEPFRTLYERPVRENISRALGEL